MVLQASKPAKKGVQKAEKSPKSTFGLSNGKGTHKRAATSKLSEEKGAKRTPISELPAGEEHN